MLRERREKAGRWTRKETNEPQVFHEARKIQINGFVSVRPISAYYCREALADKAYSSVDVVGKDLGVPCFLQGSGTLS